MVHPSKILLSNYRYYLLLFRGVNHGPVCDQSSSFCTGESLSAGQSSSAFMDRSSALFICEDFSLSCEFGHEREVGVIFKNVDISSGEVTVNLNEELLSKSKSSSNTLSDPDKAIESTIDSVASKKAQKNQQLIAAISKYTTLFPEKVCNFFLIGNNISSNQRKIISLARYESWIGLDILLSSWLILLPLSSKKVSYMLKAKGCNLIAKEDYNTNCLSSKLSNQILEPVFSNSSGWMCGLLYISRQNLLTLLEIYCFREVLSSLR
ncbi:hypothetical protein M0R45_027233 [Rubus argutus]|uniref:Uncharacterized protein n=1 Tax=Rubus argutus TaxID=59490 RepID=A0AAW1X188_RUBAR